jgi:hypothetical protein
MCSHFHLQENGGGIETLMSGLNLGPEDPSDKASMYVGSCLFLWLLVADVY